MDGRFLMWFYVFDDLIRWMMVFLSFGFLSGIFVCWFWCDISDATMVFMLRVEGRLAFCSFWN